MAHLPARWIVTAAMVVALSAAGLAAGRPSTAMAAQDGGAAVGIVDFAFEPAALEVAAGTTVTWTNQGAAPHTVTATDGAFDSGRLEPGASFSQSFDTPGTFSYFCAIHPSMTGTITVTEAAAAEEPAAEEATAEAAASADDGGEAAGGDAAAAEAPARGGAGRTTGLPASGVGTTASSDGIAASLVLLAGAGVAFALAVARRRQRA